MAELDQGSDLISGFFVVEVKEKIEQLGGLLDQLQSLPNDMLLIEHIEANCRSIQESANSFNFTDVAHVMAELEAYITHIRHGHIPADDHAVRVMAQVQHNMLRLMEHALGEDLSVNPAQVREHTLELLRQQTSGAHSGTAGAASKNTALPQILSSVKEFTETLAALRENPTELHNAAQMQVIATQLLNSAQEYGMNSIATLANFARQVSDALSTGMISLRDDIDMFLRDVMESVTSMLGGLLGEQVDDAALIDALREQMRDLPLHIMEEIETPPVAMDTDFFDFSADTAPPAPTGSAPPSGDVFGGDFSTADAGTGTFLNQGLNFVRMFTDQLQQYRDNPFDDSSLDNAIQHVTELREGAIRADQSAVVEVCDLLSPILDDLKNGTRIYDDRLARAMQQVKVGLNSLLSALAGQEINPDHVVSTVRKAFITLDGTGEDILITPPEASEAPSFEAMSAPEETASTASTIAPGEFLSEALTHVQGYSEKLFQGNPLDPENLNAIYEHLAYLHEGAQGVQMTSLVQLTAIVRALFEKLQTGEMELNPDVTDLLHDCGESFITFLSSMTGERVDDVEIMKLMRERFEMIGMPVPTDLEVAKPVPAPTGDLLVEHEIETPPPPKPAIPADSILGYFLEQIREFSGQMSRYEMQRSEAALHKAIQAVVTIKHRAEHEKLEYIARIADLMENTLKQVESGTLMLDIDYAEALRDGAETITTLLGQLEGETVDEPSIYGVIRDRFAALGQAPTLAPLPAEPGVTPPSEPQLTPEVLSFFLAEARDHLETVQQQLVVLQANLTDSEPLEKIQRALHTLMGSAAMLDLKRISDAASAIRNTIKSAIEGELTITAANLPTLEQATQALGQLVDGLEGMSIDAPQLLQQIQAWMNAVQAQTPSTSPLEDEFFDVAPSEPVTESVGDDSFLLEDEFFDVELSPAVESEPPALEDEFLAAESEQPALEDEFFEAEPAPPVEAAQPALEDEFFEAEPAPPVEAAQPALEDEFLAAEAEQPALEDEFLAVESEPLALEDEFLTAEAEQPALEDEFLAAESEQPALEDEFLA
ncbi:MAG: hypothetical protein D6675_08485, partial [Gemmatimonadetes bacterium]